MLALFFDFSLLTSANQETTVKEMNVFFLNPYRAFFVYFAGGGGYLLIRYILERMPDKIAEKNEPEE
jgi:hypothetical protein